MRRIPAWILLIVALLGVGLLIVGIDERDHLGPVPMTLGALWVLFALASAPRVFSQK